MDKVKLVEKLTIFPETPTQRRRIYLSNLDHGLVAYQESADFFNPPSNQMSFSDCCQTLKRVLSRLLVDYDFFAGRLVMSEQDNHRFEIDCDGAGIVFASAESEMELSQLGDHITPSPMLEQFVAFVRPKDEGEMEINDLPLISIQLTQLKCGSLAFVTRYNHCVVDGIALRESALNLAALTRGEPLVIKPNPDRTMFKARNPPIINHPHYEFSKGTDSDNVYAVHWKRDMYKRDKYKQNCVMYMSSQQIERLKKSVTGDGKLSKCTSFDALAAKIWKAKTISMGTDDERISTILFPVDTRKRVVPHAPKGFSGNALAPGYARMTVKELKDEEEYVLVKEIRDGVERMDDEYVRSSIDWLEVNKGVLCNEDSFSLVSWWRLGYEELEFVWGKVVCSTPIEVKPGLVVLIPESSEKGGINVCLEMPADQFSEFQRLMMEE